MARPQKQGIDYFCVDTNIQEDDKIQFIEAEHGNVGFAILIKILIRIYGIHGYYSVMTEREQKLFSNKNNVNINEVNAIINTSLNEVFFDKKLFINYGILTSRAIQERYFKAIERRKSVKLFREFLLIEPPNYKDLLYEYEDINLFLINANINKENEYINSINENMMYESIPKVKESKVKESKVNINTVTRKTTNAKSTRSKTNDVDETVTRKATNAKSTRSKTNDVDNTVTYAEFVRMTNDEYQTLINQYGEQKTKRMIEILDNYKGSNGKVYKSDYRAILSWVIDKVMQEKNQDGSQKVGISVNNKPIIPQHVNFQQREYTEDDYKDFYTNLPKE